ncbi:hypothetical protein GCM10008905_21690 [Clostridium malenominatum]|uniref:Diguanylate cyclase n=1 Tax=Clostridium malenominatum TaxID=1539 RepID=A0ABN1J1U4_9CLOT
MYERVMCSNCKESLQNIIDAMYEGYAVHEIICDNNGIPIDYRYIEANLAFEKITGFKRKDIIGKTIKEVSPEIDSFWIDTYGEVALTGKPRNFENYDELLDKYFRVSVFSHKKGIFTTIFTDISENKIIEETLEKHKLLVESAQDAILYVKDNGIIIDANKSAIRFYQYTYEELLNLSIHDIRHPSTRDKFEQQIKQADESGIIFESIHVRKDGSIFPVEVSAKGTIIRNGRVRIHIIRNITERKMTEEKITYLANYDSLTGIPNRAYLMHELDISIERARRGAYKLAVIFFDIDKFKSINDTYGHDAGDKVLKTVAERVQDKIRKVDTLGRLGGDEFIIIQPLIEKDEDVLALINRVFKALDEPIFVESSELKVSISISIGISVYPDDAKDMSTLLSNADHAMYGAKKESGNSYKFP